jgi:hypothetical protein
VALFWGSIGLALAIENQEPRTKSRAIESPVLGSRFSVLGG